MFGLFRSYFTSFFSFFGFSIDEIPLNLVILGLDNAGKTTLQYKLSAGKFLQFAPTQKANDLTIEIGKTKIRAWDLGGHKAVRKTWKSYSAAADGIIFLVDSADQIRLDECRMELHGLLESKEFIDLPVAILANKQDLDGCMEGEMIREKLKLNDLGHVRIEYFIGSVLNGTGYLESIHWIISQMKNK